MTTMIERVARAMVAADSGPEGSQLFDIHMSGFGDGYRASARAAIEAMRVPTDAMCEAAHSGSSPGEPNSFYEMWDYAIDAALNEKEPANA